MELYTLDGLLRRNELVEGYESYIWTERYADGGDCTIITPSTQQFRNLLASGTFLGLSESKRVMKIDTLNDVTDSTDGSKKLTITATEIIDVANERVAKTGTAGVEVNTWAATAKPSDIIRLLFDTVLRNSVNGDKLAQLVAGSLYAAGNLPEETTVLTVERDIGPLFDAMKEFADIYDLGMRLYKGLDDGKLYFDVYKGNNRTTSQSTLAPVVFSEDLESLQGVSELTSIARSKNVAYVQNEYMTLEVYAVGTTSASAGFARRVIFVEANDIKYPERTNTITDAQQVAINKSIADPTTLDAQKEALQKLIDRVRFVAGENALIKARTAAQVTSAVLTAGEKTLIDSAADASTALEAAEVTKMTADLTQRGAEELAKNRSFSAFDGEVTQLSPYKYNRDYELGDLVEMRNSTGLTNQMLVTEQIFSADGSGERGYPTLVIKQNITPGSWLAWESNQVWQDAPGTWATS